MTDRVRLFYHPISHYCVSAERMLRFKKVRSQLVYTPYHDHVELLRRTGQDYIPTLEWNRKVRHVGEDPRLFGPSTAHAGADPRRESGPRPNT